MVERRTPEPDVGARPTSAVLCLEQDTLLPESTGNTREPVATSRYHWKVVEWDVKSQHEQTNPLCCNLNVSSGTKCMQ